MSDIKTIWLVETCDVYYGEPDFPRPVCWYSTESEAKERIAKERALSPPSDTKPYNRWEMHEVEVGPGASKPIAASTMRMRRFQLWRDVDETGTSGPGLVAEGCEFTSGACALTWLTPFKTVSMWDSIKALDSVHGHNGATRVVWVD